MFTMFWVELIATIKERCTELFCSRISCTIEPDEFSPIFRLFTDQNESNHTVFHSRHVGNAHLQHIKSHSCTLFLLWNLWSPWNFHAIYIPLSGHIFEDRFRIFQAHFNFSLSETTQILTLTEKYFLSFNSKKRKGSERWSGCCQDRSR